MAWPLVSRQTNSPIPDPLHAAELKSSGSRSGFVAKCSIFRFCTGRVMRIILLVGINVMLLFVIAFSENTNVSAPDRLAGDRLEQFNAIPRENRGRARASDRAHLARRERDRRAACRAADPHRTDNAVQAGRALSKIARPSQPLRALRHAADISGKRARPSIAVILG